MLQAQTHGYVLYIVTEGVTYNKQRYFKLSSDFFDPQSSLLSVLQSQTSWTQSVRLCYIPVETMHVTFDPGTCAHLASHAIKETILGIYRVKKEYKKLVDTVK